MMRRAQRQDLCYGRLASDAAHLGQSKPPKAHSDPCIKDMHHIISGLCRALILERPHSSGTAEEAPCKIDRCARSGFLWYFGNEQTPVQTARG